MNQYNNPLVIPPQQTNPFIPQQQQQQQPNINIPQTITITLQEYNMLQETVKFADLMKSITVLSNSRLQQGIKVIMKITNQDHQYLKRQTFKMPVPANPMFQTISFNNVANSGLNYEFSFERF